MSNPLDPIMDWYSTAYDSIRVTQRVLYREIRGAITDKHKFRTLPQESSIEQLREAKDQLDRLVVLALASVFERTLRDFLSQTTRYKKPRRMSDREHLNAVVLRINRDIERWTFKEDLLSAFPAVDANCRGQVKQIVDFRNWVAHGHNYYKPAPSQIDPGTAYIRLTEFLQKAGLLHP